MSGSNWLRALVLLPVVLGWLPTGLAAPVRQTALPVQSGAWTHGEVGDWLPGTFTGTYVEGSVLRLEPGLIRGEYLSAPLQAPFGFNAGQVVWDGGLSATQALTIELRSSIDGQRWSDWQPARAVLQRQSFYSQVFVFPLFTSWLQYRVTLTSDGTASPTLDQISLSYINSTAGPALADLAGRVPLPGPATLTPTPEAIARSDWAGTTAPPAERQQPQRVELTQVLAPVDDPNPPATLRAMRHVWTPVLGTPELPYHYLIDGQGLIYESWGSPTRRLPDAPAGTVRLALLADAEREGISEATQARLIDVLAWLSASYDLQLAAITAAADAPPRLATLIDELRPAIARSMIRWQRLFAAGSTQAATARLAVFNPGAQEAQAIVTAFTPNGEERRTLLVPAGQRVDLTLNGVLPELPELGLEVQADRPLQIERTLIAGREILGSSGSASPARVWYFAEGTTAAGAETALAILNPQRQEVAATLTFYVDGTTPTSQRLVLAPRSRTTLRLSEWLPDAGFGFKLVASQPVVAERSVQLPGGAAHLSGGSATLSRSWYFAEGATIDGVTTTLHLLNPWPQQLATTLEVLSEDGTSLSRRYAIPPQARLVVTLNDVVPALPFALQISAERPIAAERVMLLDNGASATAAPGAPQPATRWTFVEGSTAATAQEFLLIANPNRASSAATITYVLADGAREERQVSIPGRSRLTVLVNEHVPEQPIVSAIITAERPVVAERSIYVPNPAGRGAETSLGLAGR